MIMVVMSVGTHYLVSMVHNGHMTNKKILDIMDIIVTC
jgi:hypothetical protein